MDDLASPDPGRSRSHARAGLVPALCALLALCGCGLFGVGSGPDVGGPGIPQAQDAESFPGERREVTGEVLATNEGCVFVVVSGVEYFAIWPSGSDGPDDSGRLLLLPDGDAVRDGDSIVGVGALTPVRPLVADRNGYWASVIGYCAPDIETAMVLDHASVKPSNTGD